MDRKLEFTDGVIDIRREFQLIVIWVFHAGYLNINKKNIPKIVTGGDVYPLTRSKLVA